MKYDIYSQSSYTFNDGKIKERLVIGGYENFNDAAKAVQTLTTIHTNRETDPPKVFKINECKHKDMDERIRDTVRHNQIDRQHAEPTTDTDKLINAYFGV